MNRACGAYGGRRETYAGLWWGNLSERGHLRDPGVDGDIILKWILKKLNRQWGPIYQAQDRGKRQAVVTAVLTFRVS